MAGGKGEEEGLWKPVVVIVGRRGGHFGEGAGSGVGGGEERGAGGRKRRRMMGCG